MPVQINDDYRIENDTYNWVLQQRRVSKPKEDEPPQERWVNIGFFGKIEHLVNRLIQEDLKESEANTLDELLNKLEHNEKRLTTRIKESL